ncbi:polysaccharide deacetylase family protein [Lysinibacillus sphaericus]|uniref:Polysaccharide deacetylase n=1 Tax=Lysinibacillus sphaericus OT4b.31 TaxID=1285586 RepID=R7ZE24_LYSSH|nr:polysaccharide deacetylase family protein [Lysinibacillus sphaericus]EON72382.1 polysaccharide deacetylase [Lysinibacillus sphaericus OT4b.31]
MKKFYLFLIPICILVVSVFYVNESSSADKGRKYYEEAGQIVWEIQTKEKIVALTFDDGPHKKYTSEILDLLAQYDAKATFFVVGQNAEKNPEVVLRMYEEGHEIANHTYTHPLKTNVPNLMKEIKQTHETIYSISGYSPILFRPVEGQYTDAMISAVVKEGYKVVMWSWHLDTLDWKNPGVNKIVDTVLRGVKEGNVVLFHDGGGNRQQTVKAMEKILPELEKKGYKFVTIPELLKAQKENIK